MAMDVALDPRPLSTPTSEATMQHPQPHPKPLSTSVIGASLAGLFAAAAAANAGHQVTIIERDGIPTTPQARRGVPQSEQTHILLHRGLLSAEHLLPGLHDELIQRGAPEFKVGRMALLSADGWAPRGDYGYPLVCSSRTLLEHVIRKRVLALPNVRVLEQTRVQALHQDPSGAWTIQLQPTDHSSSPGGEHSLAADLVIDASGRSSRLPTWLKGLGLPPVPTTTIDARVGYATRRFTSPRPPGPGVLMLASARQSRGCIVSPVEDGYWQVTTVGRGEDRPSRDGEEFLEHLAKLPDPMALDMVKGMTPVSDVVVHRQTANVRHHYGKSRRWPAGLLVTGDALCALNPVYGSGITVAACQGLLLERSFMKAQGGRLNTRRLQRGLARTADLPWTMATSQDRQLLTTPQRARPVEAVVGWWGSEVARLAGQGNDRAADVMQAVTHLMSHPIALFTPPLLLASLRSRLRPRRSQAPEATPARGPRPFGGDAHAPLDLRDLEAPALAGEGRSALG
ncbi:NAD(P)/FAD-dependent oxidoreductase [Kineococcus radiotolerans]|nr:FAD-dependent monooxygenase [Kineococcus radiotolerans]